MCSEIDSVYIEVLVKIKFPEEIKLWQFEMRRAIIFWVLIKESELDTYEVPILRIYREQSN